MRTKKIKSLPLRTALLTASAGARDVHERARATVRTTLASVADDAILFAALRTAHDVSKMLDHSTAFTRSFFFDCWIHRLPPVVVLLGASETPPVPNHRCVVADAGHSPRALPGRWPAPSHWRLPVPGSSRIYHRLYTRSGGLAGCQSPRRPCCRSARRLAASRLLWSPLLDPVRTVLLAIFSYAPPLPPTPETEHRMSGFLFQLFGLLLRRSGHHRRHSVRPPGHGAVLATPLPTSDSNWCVAVHSIGRQCLFDRRQDTVNTVILIAKRY